MNASAEELRETPGPSRLPFAAIGVAYGRPSNRDITSPHGLGLDAMACCFVLSARNQQTTYDELEL
jgi:hypothetical protein